MSALNNTAAEKQGLRVKCPHCRRRPAVWCTKKGTNHRSKELHLKRHAAGRHSTLPDLPDLPVRRYPPRSPDMRVCDLVELLFEVDQTLFVRFVERVTRGVPESTDHVDFYMSATGVERQNLIGGSVVHVYLAKDKVQ